MGGVYLIACWDTRPNPPILQDTVNMQAVRILLECILVIVFCRHV